MRFIAGDGEVVKQKQRIMLVFGTRPEAIKMAPVYRALLADPDVFEPLCCVTAQHRQMLDETLSIFGIDPEIDLDLMRTGQELADLSAAVLTAMQPALRSAKPDLVLVHGDTTTCMASALAAFYAGIPVGHVEAGLRSADLRSPFPEEFNRRLVGMVARFHFAPTAEAQSNLLREACHPSSIAVTGNTVVDALNSVLAEIDRDDRRRLLIEGALDRELAFDWRCDRYVLVTCHRRETFVRGLDDLCGALVELSGAFPGLHFVFPVHPNPMVRQPVEELLAGHRAIHLIRPLPYDAFLTVLRHCHFALTDSGGLQEEAPSLGKPVLVLRDITERPEAVAAGVAQLVGAGRAGIVAGAMRLLSDEPAYARMIAARNPYGDGRAAQRIVDFLKHAWQERESDGPPGAPLSSHSRRR